MKKYFLDTSFLLDLMKERERAIEIHKKIREDELTGTPCIYELSKFAQFDVSEFFSQNQVLVFDGKDAESAGRIYQNLKKSGQMIGEIDVIISGMVKNRDLVLVTKDKDFEKVKELELKIYST